MSEAPFLLLPLEQIPAEREWLHHQPRPVIAVGDPAVGANADNADVVVASAGEAEAIAANIEQYPIASMTYVQVLRCVECLPLQSAMTVESLAYATLQGGAEFGAWLAARGERPEPVVGGEGLAVIAEREGNIIRARLNRPQNRNSLSVEMRDALVELLEVVLADTAIERLELAANGACFSVGGELREFGLFANTGQAHLVRSLQNPSRLLARCADRVRCHVHSACMGSGMELPAFAGRVSADSRAFFQLPELKLGLIPGAGGCVSISRRIGRQRTAWLGLSCRKITARTALAWGLVDEIV